MGYGIVLSVKDMTSTNGKFKARIVILGNHDSGKRKLVHKFRTIRPLSLRLILKTAAIIG